MENNVPSLLPAGYVTSKEAAGIMGVTRARVNQLCKRYGDSKGAEGMPCQRVDSGGHVVYLIRCEVADEWRGRVVPDATGERKPGRPAGTKGIKHKQHKRKSAAPASQQGGASGEASQAT